MSTADTKLSVPMCFHNQLKPTDIPAPACRLPPPFDTCRHLTSLCTTNIEQALSVPRHFQNPLKPRCSRYLQWPSDICHHWTLQCPSMPGKRLSEPMKLANDHYHWGHFVFEASIAPALWHKKGKPPI